MNLLNPKHYPHHNAAGLDVLQICLTQNDRLHNGYCEHGCEIGSPNCAYHVQQRDCSAVAIKDRQ